MYENSVMVCIEVSTRPPTPAPPQKHPPSYFLWSLLQIVQAFFRQFPIYIAFLWLSFPKNWWTPIILTFFIFNPSYLLKVTKFLVKSCQFKFLVMADKHFGLDFFCRLKFQFFFYAATAIPTFLCSEMSPPLFQQPTSKNWGSVRPPF